MLGEAGIDLADIDRIAYGWNAGFDAGRHLDLYLDRVLEEARERPEGLPHLRKRIADEMANDKAKRGEFDAFVRANGLRGKVEYIDHHECHALGAFVCSPFDEALTLTCDGRGDFQSLTVTHYRADGGEAVLQRETSVDSLGYFYGRITRLLGFKPNRHEGKITGLAAFGDAEKLLPLMNDMIRLENGRLRARCGELYLPSYDGYSDPLLQRCAAERPADVAAAAQRHSEDLLVAIAREHVARTGCANLCLAGGVFGNVKLNQRLREIPGVRDVYVLPCMGDGGLALAAAVAVAYRENGTRFPAPSMALGPDARSAECRADRQPVPATGLQPAGQPDRDAGRSAAGKPGAGHVQGPHGVRPARLVQPQHRLPSRRCQRQRLAQSAHGTHRVHAIRPGHRGRTRRGLLRWLA